jgi:hypothetical protein
VAKDRLYLLAPDFSAGGVRQFCSECAMVEGMLGFYPRLREQVEVRYVGFARPRPEIVSELGPEHQSSPVLVIADPARAAQAGMGVKVQSSNGRQFVSEPIQVCEYLAQVYGTGQPRH